SASGWNGRTDVGDFLQATCLFDVFRLMYRTARPVACRSSSREFLPCLRLPPVPCGNWLKAACLPQKVSETSREAHRLSRVPEQWSQDAEGIPQTSARRKLRILSLLHIILRDIR